MELSLKVHKDLLSGMVAPGEAPEVDRLNRALEKMTKEKDTAKAEVLMQKQIINELEKQLNEIEDSMNEKIEELTEKLEKKECELQEKEDIWN